MADDDLSNDVMSIHSNDDGYTAEDFEQAANDKPLMTLFKRLIGNDSKENTVLTNAQIIDILKKEFNMDLSYIHDLEIEIYLNLMKKFLKDWPLWDEFDQSIQTLKNRNDTSSIKKKLETNHKNLKDYLSQMLEAARPYMQKVVETTKESTVKDKTMDNTDNELVLEIQCSRQQLNQLFFRRPHPDFNNTIFNVQTPNKITINPFSLRAILNWPGIRLSVNLGSVSFRRETVHVLKHKLVNKKLNYVKDKPTELNTNLQMKDLKPMSTSTLKDLCKVFPKYSKDSYGNRVVDEISYMLGRDFSNAPDVHISALFRRNLSKFSYIRYLYTEVNTNQSFSSNSYDLQLEETMVPMFTLNISKFERIGSNTIGNWLTIECVQCNVLFGVLERAALWEHFESEHQCEPDWQCMNCNKSFTVKALAENRWSHDCIE